MISTVELHDEIRTAIQQIAAQLTACAGDYERALLAELERAQAVQEQMDSQATDLLTAQLDFARQRADWESRQQTSELELADARQQLALDKAALELAQGEFAALREALDAEHKARTRDHAALVEAFAHDREEFEARVARDERTAEELDRLQAHVAQLEAELLIAQGTIDVRDQELQTSREQLAELTSSRASLGEAGPAQLEQRCAEQTTQIVALQAELEASRVQAARLAAAAIDLADARAEIMQLREELDHAAALATKELNNQITQLRRERTELELELEAVRARATELSEDAEEERRRTSEERAHWASELRQLRRALEAQSLTLSEKEAALQAVQTTPAEPPAPVTTGGARSAKDPVLDAVMAQFQQLQKDRQHRRAMGGQGKQDVA